MGFSNTLDYPPFHSASPGRSSGVQNTAVLSNNLKLNIHKTLYQMTTMSNAILGIQIVM